MEAESTVKVYSEANGLVPLPQYVLYLNGLVHSASLHVTTQQYLDELSKLIHDPKTPALCLGDKIVAIRVVRHPLGWPFRQTVNSIVWNSSPGHLKRSGVGVPLRATPSEVTPQNPGFDVMGHGTLKTREFIPYNIVEQINQQGRWVILNIKAARTRDWCSRIAVLASDESWATRLVRACQSQRVRVLTVNERIRTIVLIPAKASECLRLSVFGLENLDPKTIEMFTKAHLEHGANGAWVKNASYASDTEALRQLGLPD